MTTVPTEIACRPASAPLLLNRPVPDRHVQDLRSHRNLRGPYTAGGSCCGTWFRS